MVIALVDDRPEDRVRLTEVLEKYGSVNGRRFDLHAFDSGEALMMRFQAHRYQLIFLDVIMGDGWSGVETAERIRRMDEDVILVFLTTSDEHQADAIHWHVFDYLDKENLQKNVFQVMDRILRRQTRLEAPRLSFVAEKDPVSLPYDDLVYLTADRNYLIIHDRTGNQYRTRATFSSVWETLRQDDRFLPVLRGVIVNMEYLTDISSGVCVLKGNIRVPINIRNSEELEKTWTNFTFARIRRESMEGRNAE